MVMTASRAASVREELGDARHVDGAVEQVLEERDVHDRLDLGALGIGRRKTAALENAEFAATAVVHDLAVVTRNVDDFVRAGIAVVNPWKT